jgi:hypothetical protein
VRSVRCIAGGEKERKGKKVEQRFRDRRRPKPTQDELRKLEAKREGMTIVSQNYSSFK